MLTFPTHSSLADGTGNRKTALTAFGQSSAIGSNALNQTTYRNLSYQPKFSGSANPAAMRAMRARSRMNFATAHVAMQWRVGEIGTPADKPWRYEIEPVWQSAESPAFAPQVRIPQSAFKTGRTYRVRVKHKDNVGRWSHWSEAAEFVAR